MSSPFLVVRRVDLVSRGLLVLSLVVSLTACVEPNPADKAKAPPEKAATEDVVSVAKGPDASAEPIHKVDTPSEEPLVEPVVAPEDPEAKGEKTVQPALPAEQAPSPTVRGDSPETQKLRQAFKVFQGYAVGRRIYVQVDKPLYKPGETVWFRAWDLRARDLGADHPSQGMTCQLISPKGAVVIEHRVQMDAGVVANDFVIPDGVQGGEYLIRTTAFDGVTTERPIIVSTYEPPRIKKKLEFLRKAYGAGDEVKATIEVKRPTGEALASHPLRAAIRLDGEDLPEVALSTNEFGNGIVRFTLPSEMQLGDGLLTVLIEDGGVTESVSKRIPIVLKKLQFSLFPEGGQLVSGLQSRVYFEAKNTLGKPADVEGDVVDNHGNAVARFSSVHDGLGRFELTPSTGKTYHIAITKPVGITETYPLPLANEDGCVLNSYDDLDGQLEELRVAVRCTKAQTVVAAATLRENLIDAASLEVKEGAEAVAYLKSDDAALNKAQGVARVTLFDSALQPLAERLIYRNRRNALQVEVKPHKDGYSPRDQVSLTVTTKDANGQPVPAAIALSVVDDTVIAFADDKTGHMLSKLYLEPELPGKVEEPNFYFDLTEKDSALSVDLLMGTRGWRKFEWRQVFEPPPPVDTVVATGIPMGGNARPNKQANFKRKKGGGGGEEGPELALRGADDDLEMAPPAMPAPDMAEAEGDVPMAKPEEVAIPVVVAEPAVVADAIAANQDGALGQREAGLGILGEAKMDMAKDEEWGGAMAEQEPPAWEWAPVRVFPAPTYGGAFEGPRTDFRETVEWAPNLKTDANGEVMVTFYLSDAITSFRVFAEGVGGGAAGRVEEVFKSSLPFSMNVKLPLEVSAGDSLQLPLTFSNESEEPLDVALTASFGSLLTLTHEADASQTLTIEPGSRKSLFFAVDVTGLQGDSEVRFAASSKGLSDEFVRTVRVVPRGFPQEMSFSGTAKGKLTHEADLGDAVMGTVVASVRPYPGPVSTMVSGLDGMLRQPTGCFEQASSTNYPNVMVMQYLQENDIADVQLIERSNALFQDGYLKLTGYESPQKGYEWFGGDPGHEALTAYGLLEFHDMADVYQVDPKMVERTAQWLLSRRDGKGSYLKNERALDSFGRASDDVTAGYITYALTEAGVTDLPKELAKQLEVAVGTSDPYLLALAANTLLNVPANVDQGKSAAKRLAKMQGQDGAWTGADHSITRSGGISLNIETTALAVMALLKAGGQEDAVRAGIEWMNNNRGGFGEWGATQSTVLALKAMTLYSNANRKTQNPGTVTLSVNGQVIQQVAYAAGRKDAIEFEGLGNYFQAGKNTVELVHDGEDALPYSVAIEFRTIKPATSPDVVVDLTTTLEKNTLKMGESVRLNANVKNKTDQGQPMTLARVGLPGGLTFQTWQLKELKEKGLISFYETRPREVILYLRDLKPSESKDLPIDLVATVPGEYMGPSSSSYLYYTDENKVWVDGQAVTVTQ